MVKKNGLPLLNLAYAIFIIKILKVPQDPTIKYCHNILRDHRAVDNPPSKRRVLMRKTTTPDITEDAGSVQDSEEVPTTSTDGSTGPDGSLALMETEVSRLRQDILQLKCQMHHFQSKLQRLRSKSFIRFSADNVYWTRAK